MHALQLLHPRLKLDVSACFVLQKELTDNIYKYLQKTRGPQTEASGCFQQKNSECVPVVTAAYMLQSVLVHRQTRHSCILCIKHVCFMTRTHASGAHTHRCNNRKILEALLVTYLTYYDGNVSFFSHALFFRFAFQYVTAHDGAYLQKHTEERHDSYTCRYQLRVIHTYDVMHTGRNIHTHMQKHKHTCKHTDMQTFIYKYTCRCKHACT